MAFTLEQITGYLDTVDFKYKYEKEEERIVLMTGDEDSTYLHFIRAKEDGDIFDWKMSILDKNRDHLTIKDHEHAGKVLSYILLLNYNTKFGTWEYDPSDGDIRLAVEIPLEDALMTEKQFIRIMSLMIKDSAKASDEILSILETGKIPKDESDAEMIAKLEEMIAVLKGSSSTSSSTTDDAI